MYLSSALLEYTKALYTPIYFLMIWLAFEPFVSKIYYKLGTSPMCAASIVAMMMTTTMTCLEASYRRAAPSSNSYQYSKATAGMTPAASAARCVAKQICRRSRIV